ncbi:uncharacterized protein C8orf34-like [Lingula anatina]|uniref:Uncharacterized protein C8orf34-like n=1 Tax=Lingula anatina TaxID=7574 RepID=A0A1S3H6N4_LINAN|nr:uncharacterized protein C8orf34-like [Lingula anatina]|eukprot:XP_013381780.1 uncharacterized protein C8orf34-like [Lingula anatina]
MSGQQRIPLYLERHKIGALFEELMSKIIHDQPDDPIYFLIKVLQKKHKLIKEAEDGAKGPTPTRKSTTELFSHSKKSTPELSRKSMPASAASWAQSPPDGAVTEDKQRDYEKPWLSHSKRLKPKKPATAAAGGDGENVKPVIKCSKVQLSPRSKVTQRSRTQSSEFEEFVKAPSAPRKQWNADNKVPTADFDELWEITKGGKAYQRVRDEEEREEAEAKKRESGWRSVMLGEGEDMVYSSGGYTGPYRKPMTEEEELAAELSVGRSIRSDPREREEAETESSAGSTSSKRKGPKFASEQHKKDLEKYIKKEKEDVQSQDSGYPGEDDDYDEAIEVLENPEDLKNEGITGVKTSGVRISKTMKTVEAEPQVRVSICARCARVIGGTEMSEPTRQSKFEELSEVGFERNGSAAVRFARQPPSDFADGEDDEDDEFESVSQVSGPRHPVWQAEDSDAETLTPRKGSHMFSPAGIPTKGRHMYGRDPSPPISEASTARSGRRPPGGAHVLAATAPLAKQSW